ncbi:hypothetical protein ACFCYO_35480, partial [Streptomyces sp. NPDC056308]
MPPKMALHRFTHPDHHPGVQLTVVAVGGAAGTTARRGAEPRRGRSGGHGPVPRMRGNDRAP